MIFNLNKLICLTFVFLVGCDISKIHKRDGCPYCRSAFQTNVQKTELRLEDGSQIAQFDNIGCALRFKAQHPEFAKSEIFIQTNTGEMSLNAKDLNYDDIKIDKFPHRYFASESGKISFDELEQKISTDLQ